MALAFSFLFVTDAAVASAEGDPAADAPKRNGAETAEALEQWLKTHPDDGDARIQLGWSRYRSGDFSGAAASFEAELGRDAGDLDARAGLGYALLQQGELAGAVEAFRRVLAVNSDHGDARRGLGLAIARGGGDEQRFRADADPSRPMAVPARALRDYLEVREPDGSYTPVFVKGVNLGTAIPGRYPTEFPRETATYLRWLDMIASTGANAVRVYTLLPPEFYAAIVTHNALPKARKLWLVQGVWAELPDGNDFASPDYVDEFEREIARVIDAVHGDIVVPPQPGHASGLYEADASPWLLALIIGREWEPYAVKEFDAAHPERTSFAGPWLRVERASAMESWVAAMCDFAAGYEARRHRTLHPLTFANWPTLDPLRHDSESNRDEEDAWKRRYGIPFPESLRDAPWENDAVSLDATKIVPTAAMRAGFFAAYHIYPNYPDFMNQERRAGPSRYAGYLRELKRYHGRQPVLVAEFGISSSRGVAHVEPMGWHHGGHDERHQGEFVARMQREIYDSGYAGGIVFEFMDEWFKGTWSTSPLEIPAERRRLWWNAESPEQSYGLFANRPSTPVVVDGDPGDWPRGPSPADGRSRGRGWASLRDVQTTSDEGYLYVLLRTAGGPEPPALGEAIAYRIAIDTYDAGRGETALPEPGAATIATGAEFLVDLAGPGKSFVTVSTPYEPYAAIDSGPVASPRGGAGTFAHLMFETNRERIGRDGTRYPAIRVDRGALRYGSLDPAAAGFDTLADVAVGPATGTIELRIPWALLNVTDPSSRQVLHQETVHAPPLDTATTEGFRLYAFAIDPIHPERRPLSRFPEKGEASLFSWAPWETPAYRMEPKHGVDAIRRGLAEIPDRNPAAPPPEAADAR